MKTAHASLIVTGGVLGLLGSVLAGYMLREGIDRGPEPERRLQASLEPVASDVDLQVPEGQYFLKLMDLIKREFVEPVGDDTKLAVGAVRGMVSSLVDPWSQYMNPVQFAAFQRQQRGQFDGIGVELMLYFSDDMRKLGSTGSQEDEEVSPDSDTSVFVPELKVTAVAPGSPADKAGIRPGDRIESIDGKWIPSPAVVKSWREQQRKLQAEGNTAKLNQLRQDIRTKTKNDRTPMRAKEILAENGAPVLVEWARGDQMFRGSVERKTTMVKPLEREANMTLRFFKGAERDLEAVVRDNKVLTLDLRNSFAGDTDTMLKCLEVVLPPGAAGSMRDRKGGGAKELPIKGKGDAVKLTLIVDDSTRGAAAVFAQAAQAHGVKIQGKFLPDDAVFTTSYRLSDGSGYTLVIGQYEAPKSEGTK
ncbi:MAG: hypothetical protein HONBIEJF_01313 [Fimbriimonadaceae bacterium]|nr:hypothetical protein [Fimbriimonadaceae bacterium]